MTTEETEASRATLDKVQIEARQHAARLAEPDLAKKRQAAYVVMIKSSESYKRASKTYDRTFRAWLKACDDHRKAITAIYET